MLHDVKKWRRRCAVGAHAVTLAMATATVAATMLVGCAHEADPFEAWSDAYPDRPVRSVSRGEMNAIGSGADQPELSFVIGRGDGSVEEIHDSAAVEVYVALALRDNARLIAGDLEIERQRRAVEQSDRLDDPMLTFGAGEMAETAAGRVSFTTGISQRLPLPSKLNERRLLAEQRVVEARAKQRRLRNQIAAETRRAYWNLYAVQREIEATQNSHNLLNDLTRTVETRVQTGSATQQDLLRSTTELARLDGRLIELRQLRNAAAAMLNRLVGRPSASRVPDPPIIDPADDPAELATGVFDDSFTRDQTLAVHPQMDAIRAVVERYRHELQLARLDDWPDLTIGLNYAAVEDAGLAGSANGRDQVWVQMGINLPLWREPREAARRQALAGIYQQLATLNDRQLEIDFQIADAVSRVRAQQQLMTLFADRILPDTRQTLDLAMTQYSTGSGSFLELIDHWRTLLDYELIQHRNTAQYEIALADLSEALGRSDPIEPAMTTPHREDNR